MNELQPVAVADQDAFRPQPLQGRPGLCLGKVGETSGHGQRNVRTENGGGTRHPHRVGAQSVKAVADAADPGGGDDAAQLGHVLRRRIDSSVANADRELDGFEGVAPGEHPRFTAEGVVHARSQDVPGEFAHRRGGKRSQIDRLKGCPARRRPERLAFGRQLMGPVGDNDQQRQVRHPFDER